MKITLQEKQLILKRRQILANSDKGYFNFSYEIPVLENNKIIKHNYKGYKKDFKKAKMDIYLDDKLIGSTIKGAKDAKKMVMKILGLKGNIIKDKNNNYYYV